MPPTHPFLVGDTGEIDVDRVLDEAIPIVKLVAMILIGVLIPLFLGQALVGGFGLAELLGEVLVLLAQFIGAIGGSVVLLYVVSRGIQIANA